MTYDELKVLFEKHEDEFLKFEKVKGKARLHSCPDICAFILLADRFGIKKDMVTCAEHDEIWLEPSLDTDKDLPLQEDDVVTLIRCGTRLDTGVCSFAMFV